MSNLIDLYIKHNQSPWLDNLKRSWIDNGELEKWIDKGVRGITSNPSIFAKAMMESQDYDIEFNNCLDRGLAINEAYWELVITDIKAAANLLMPLYESSNRLDGYISVEVSPELAHSEPGTIESARTLANRISRENLYIKIPATDQGIGAIRQLTTEERSLNVTLIFTLSRYQQVIDAYIEGLENSKENLETISSVASFFISRIDVVADKMLKEIGTEEALSLIGKAGISQGKLAYKKFTESFSGERWENLAAKGAQVQRVLWASMSPKDPKFKDTYYVDALIGPKTVSTLPEGTLTAVDESGTVSRTVDADVDQAIEIISKLTNFGIDLEKIGETLEKEGIKAFAESFQTVLGSLESKANSK